MILEYVDGVYIMYWRQLYIIWDKDPLKRVKFRNFTSGVFHTGQPYYAKGYDPFEQKIVDECG